MTKRLITFVFLTSQLLHGVAVENALVGGAGRGLLRGDRSSQINAFPVSYQLSLTGALGGFFRSGVYGAFHYASLNYSDQGIEYKGSLLSPGVGVILGFESNAMICDLNLEMLSAAQMGLKTEVTSNVNNQTLYYSVFNSLSHGSGGMVRLNFLRRSRDKQLGKFLELFFGLGVEVWALNFPSNATSVISSQPSFSPGLETKASAGSFTLGSAGLVLVLKI